jgi:hypothetical protein
MANDVTGDRLWTMDTVAVVADAGEEIIVRKIVFTPGAVNDDVLVQEYGPDAALRSAMKLKANATDVNLVTLDWGPQGRRLNGFKLATIDGGTLDIYLGLK